MNLKWNGLTCKARKVLVKIKDTSEGDFFKWWKEYVGKVVEALEVDTGNSVFHIYNGDGSGLRKIQSGGGPNMSHVGFDNYEVWDAGEGVDIVKIKECIKHEWSKDKQPIFKTDTEYCTTCRFPKIFLQINRS